MKMPGRATISNRSSTLASQFARARAPYFVPTHDEIVYRCSLFGVDAANPECIYCGGAATEWDHIRPMVSRSGWTGFFTELNNLVPAYGKCNQSRGSRAYATWMRGDALRSPRAVIMARNRFSRTEADAEIERRIALIDAALAAHPPQRIEPSEPELEAELEQCRNELNTLLYRAEMIAARLRATYQRAAETARTPVAAMHKRTYIESDPPD